MLKRLDFSNTRAKALVEIYNDENVRLRERVTPTIYDQIIQQKVDLKIAALEVYLNQYFRGKKFA